jgi:penicillin amidase
MVTSRRLDQARGLSALATLIARQIRIPIVRRTIGERLADLPVRDLPLERPVTVRWNDHQLPFIEAGSDTDLAVALGAVHMHLRAAQIEVLRLLATGRVAEIIGPLGVDIDRQIRSLGAGDAAPAIIAGLPDASRAWIEGFLAGFNHHQRHAARAPELAMLGIEPDPWTLVDFFTLARLFSADLSWPVQRRLLALRGRIDKFAWRALWPVILRGGAPDLPPVIESGTERAIAAATRSGSNAAAIAGERTRHGAPIVSGDPHLGIQMPNAWLAVSLAAPGLSAAGLMLPGMPFLALGRNRDIAWGGTSLHAASTDFVDLSGLPPDAITTTTEQIRVRGFPSRTITRRHSPYGPVVSDGLFRSRTPVAFKWMGHRPSDELTAMLGLLRARDRTDFLKTLNDFGVPGQTMVYAGPDGIGRQTAAHMPARQASAPEDIVVMPTVVDRDWRTIVKGGALFGEWNPDEGFIASANERLSGPAPRHVPLGYFFAADERISRIRALLAPDGEWAGRKIDAGDMAALFQDHRQPNAAHTRDLLLAHMPPARTARTTEFRDVLQTWDAGYGAASRGALAFELLLGETARRLLGRDRLAALETVWTTRALVTAELARHAGAALARAVAASLPVVVRRFRHIGHWGRAHRHRPQHPFAALPGLGRRFRLPAFDGDGGNDTLNKTGHPLLRGRHIISFGATARYVFDLRDIDANEVVLFGGQDGWLGSDNYADQIPLWRAGRAMSLPLRPETAQAEFRHVTVLRPD